MSVGLAYAIANAIFGGSAEYVALWFRNSGVETSFYSYVTFMCAIALVASILMPDPKVRGYLQGTGTELQLRAPPRELCIRLPKALS
jgi:hypothetical protein